MCFELFVMVYNCHKQRLLVGHCRPCHRLCPLDCSFVSQHTAYRLSLSTQPIDHPTLSAHSLQIVPPSSSAHRLLAVPLSLISTQPIDRPSFSAHSLQIFPLSQHTAYIIVYLSLSMRPILPHCISVHSLQIVPLSFRTQPLEIVPLSLLRHSLQIIPLSQHTDQSHSQTTP